MPRPRLALVAPLALMALVAGCTEAAAPETAPQAQDRPAPATEAPTETPAETPAAASDAADTPPEPHVTPPKSTLAGEWLKSPPGSAAKGCFAEETRPAVVETVTEHVMVSGEERDALGVVTAPASYRTTSQARIVAGGDKMWFATVCDKDLTQDRVATLQRALSVRGLYLGPITGRIDAPTREAIRSYQSQRGLISATLSLRAAREMGLLPWGDVPGPDPEADPEADPAPPPKQP